MIVGIDVGNTAIKWTTDLDSECVRSVRPNPGGANGGSLAKLAAELYATTGSVRDAVEIRIASVNRTAAARLIEGLQSSAPDNWKLRPIARADIPIEVGVQFPERVGIDRLVGAYGAKITYRFPLVVIDAGTTVTVDYVDADGVFQGGAIMPGLMMQTAALASGTDALPELDWDSSCCGGMNETPPGKDTVAAIRLGVLSSVVGGIERLIAGYGNPANVIVTGGDGECITKALKVGNHREKHLVCRTLVQLD